MSAYPTPFPDVNVLLGELLSEVKNILGNNFVGMYLYGSLASGDFDLRRSDVDFVIITNEEISGDEFAALESMHKAIAESGLKFATKLEGAYISQKEIRRHTSSDAEFPILNEGRFYLGRLGSDWIIQRHILRECGVTVEGKSPETLMDAVTPGDLRRAVVGILNEWWAPMLDNPAWVRSEEYQAYAVLTMCRTLFTIENGSIASKPVSARWAQRNLDKKYAGLIERALAWRHGDRFNKLDETLDFIRYTVDLTNKSCQSKAKNIESHNQKNQEKQ